MESLVSKFEQFLETEDNVTLSNNSLDWLTNARKKGIAHFAKVGLPTPRDEHWKYTNVAPIKKKEFSLTNTKEHDVKAADLDVFRFKNLETIELVFINGLFCSALSSTVSDERGIVLNNLSSWLAEGHQQDLTVDAGDYVFASLNNAFMSDGAVLHVADNELLEKPVHLIFVATDTEQATMTYPRIDIRLGKNAEAKLIESYVSLGEAKNLTNVLTNIIADENSQLEHYRIQEESDAAYHLANIFIEQKKDSRVTSHSVSLGSAIARVDAKVNLSETGTENILNGLFLGKGRQHTDHHLLVHHLSPHTRSEEYFKGILDNASRGVFNGKVVVHKDAQKIEAIQSNKNLLLSPNAEVDTKPELEIYADDVKCAHGATIGRLSDTELFYLRSRGISEEKARALLTFAFADDVVNRMSLVPVREYLERKLIGQLSSSDQIDDLKDLI